MYAVTVSGSGYPQHLATHHNAAARMCSALDSVAVRSPVRDDEEAFWGMSRSVACGAVGGGVKEACVILLQFNVHGRSERVSAGKSSWDVAGIMEKVANVPPWRKATIVKSKSTLHLAFGGNSILRIVVFLFMSIGGWGRD